MELNYLDLYTSLVKTNSLLPHSIPEIDSTISFFRNAVKSTPDNDEDYLEKYYEGLSLGIYKLSENIQNIVDELKRVSSETPISRGITHSDKINVMLLGETSAGKTSFLYRIYGEDCGSTGPTPITAFSVIHKITNKDKSYLEVKFNKKFTIVEKVDQFKDFIQKYDFYGQFQSFNGEYTTENNDFTINEKSEFLNFIYEANEYPQAFEEIIWHHRSYPTRQLGFTQFANLYDMPGSGGEEQHTSNIEKAIEKYKKDIDIILYLVKSDQGLPSSYTLLKSLKKQFDNQEIHPEFFFVYQIRNEDSFDDKVQSLKDFIYKEIDSEANEPFNENERDYYSNTYVVDARGKKNDDIKANIALASILQTYMIHRGEKYYHSLRLKNIPQEYDILDSGEENTLKINSYLYNFLQEINLEIAHKGSLISIDEVKNKFQKKFFLDKNYSVEKYNYDLQRTLESLRREIDDILNSILDYLTRRESITDLIEIEKEKQLNEKKESSFFTRIMKGTVNKTVNTFISNKPKQFDSSKYNSSFYETYAKRKEWNTLIYKIQSYHWLRLTYDKKSLNKEAKSMADAVLDSLKEYLNRLIVIKNEVKVIAPLKQEE